jgi:hypothetical protein
LELLQEQGHHRQPHQPQAPLVAELLAIPPALAAPVAVALAVALVAVALALPPAAAYGEGQPHAVQLFSLALLSSACLPSSL